MTSGQTSKTKQGRSSDLCIGETAVQTGNEAQTGPTSGQRTSLRTRSQCFPSKVLCPDWNPHIPRVERAFLRNSKLVCISHLLDYSALRGETGFLSEYRRPSQPIISVLEIRWTSSNRPHPARDPALLLNGPMNIYIILLSDYQALPLHPPSPSSSIKRSISQHAADKSNFIIRRCNKSIRFATRLPQMLQLEMATLSNRNMMCWYDKVT